MEDRCPALRAGDRWRIAFESAGQTWRHGIWLGVNGGEIQVGDVCAPQVIVWMDDAAGGVEVVVRSSDDGLLRIYNIWDSGRGVRPDESQMHTSGMVREPVEGGFRYRCSAIASVPAFDQLVFTACRQALPG